MIPAPFTGRQNIDEWMRQVGALTALNGLDDAQSIAFARQLLAPEIKTAETPNAAHRHTLDDLKVFLEAYLVGDDRYRLGALDQIRDKKYKIDQDPKDFKREINTLFRVARIGNDAEKVRLLEEMLPDQLYGVVIAGQSDNINEAIALMDHYWRRQRKNYVQESDSTSLTRDTEKSMVKILAEALAQKNERPFRSNTPSSRPSVTCNYCHQSGHTIQKYHTH